MECLKNDFFEQNPSQKDLETYYCEIDCFNILTGKKDFHKCYNLAGESIYDETTSAENTIIDENYSPKFEKGNIVIIKSHKTSTFGLFKDTIGVVAGVPTVFGQEYLIDFVNDRGFYDHAHPNEDELKLFCDKLPDELRFLYALSDHYSETQIIPENVFEKLLKCDVYLLNHKIWRDYDIEQYRPKEGCS